MYDLELRAQTWVEMDHREWCVVCHAPMKNEGLAFSWMGKPVCDDCPSDAWKERQRSGYARARSAEESYYGYDIGIRLKVWMEAIFDYAAELEARRTARAES